MRSIVRNVDGWGSPIGFSATNMRYVTITKSRFYNNAAGIVPNALDSEKFPPPEDNVIIDNDIFWNNFNYHDGNPPFAVREDATAALVPVGTGVLLLGGRGNRIENNRIHGNYLAGVAAIQGILLQKNPDAKDLQRNIVRNNAFGPGRRRHQRQRRDVRRQRQRQLLLDGRRHLDVPRRRLDVRRLQRAERVQPVGAEPDARLHRRGRAERLEEAPASRHEGLHAPRGLQVRVLIALIAGVALLSAAPAHGAAKKTVNLGDNYYTPQTLKVKRGTTVTWKWPGFEQAGDVHDVKLKSGPKGVKKFHSEAASTDFSFKRKLKVRGDLQARLHAPPEMRMTIKVRK